MASRMDRYRNDTGRSVKNQDIYKQMEDIGSYSNIEGIATIEDNNEVNITKIKEMLKNRENYQKEKRYRDLVSSEEKAEELKKDIEEIERKYDIKDVLTTALKTRSVTDNDNHKFESSKYDILKELSKEHTKDDLKEMIDTINTPQKDTNDGGLFDDLKTTENEEITDITIKKIIEDAKETEKGHENDTMDQTFFTNSLQFTNEDFEDFKEMRTDIRKNNKLLKTLSIILIICVIIFLVFIIIK